MRPLVRQNDSQPLRAFAMTSRQPTWTYGSPRTLQEAALDGWKLENDLIETSALDLACAKSIAFDQPSMERSQECIASI